MNDSKVDISFNTELTSIHISELLYFKDMELPDYLKLFYQQTNGLLIESEYFLDELDSPSHFRLLSLEDLSFTTTKLNFLPEKRFIRFAENEEEAIYLLDMENLDPDGKPLILLNLPAYRFCIPFTNSPDILFECACLGILGVIEKIAENEGQSIPPIPQQLLKKKATVLACLKNCFLVAKREYDLLRIWHISPKAYELIKKSLDLWFNGISKLLSIFS
ncbi:MAG: hypothetical protein JXA54_00260 [Candidatus Heimdallarchaeota archaeon]|nr:hypothetical protein [Candidatus Heimdallarchaeota archaeon]